MSAEPALCELRIPENQAANHLPTDASASKAFRDAARVQQSIASGMEKKVLLWLAARMPAWINSDHLTALGFVSMILAFFCYALARWHSVGLLLATVCLALNWFGDSLDGTLARLRNRQRPRYGFYVDHITDSLGALFLMGGLAMSSYIDWRVAVGMLVAFLLLSIESYLATYVLAVFHLSFWKFSPTEIRILLGIGNIVLWLRPHSTIPGLHYRLFDFGGMVAIAGMAAMLLYSAAAHTIALYKEETR